MNLPPFTAGIVSLVLAATGFVIAAFQFHEKGFLFNNLYIISTRKERGTMDKKQLYRQSAATFGLLGLMFLCLGLVLIFR